MADESGRFKFELDPESIEDSLKQLGEKVRRLAGDHRHSKVRLLFRGKPLLPDIPLALFIAGQAASFWWAGPVRVVLLNLGIGSIIEVELVNEADERVAEGRASFMEGEVDVAEEAYRDALRMKPGDFAASYSLAVLLRVRGDQEGARELLEDVLAEPPEHHPDLGRARALLEKLG